jgi:hypothetical protein
MFGHVAKNRSLDVVLRHARDAASTVRGMRLARFCHIVTRAARRDRHSHSRGRLGLERRRLRCLGRTGLGCGRLGMVCQSRCTAASSPVASCRAGVCTYGIHERGHHRRRGQGFQSGLVQIGAVMTSTRPLGVSAPFAFLAQPSTPALLTVAPPPPFALPSMALTEAPPLVVSAAPTVTAGPRSGLKERARGPRRESRQHRPRCQFLDRLCPARRHRRS